MRRLLALSLFIAAPLAAQVPAVGAPAPDVAFRVTTREGTDTVLRRLGDFRGQTVVLAFFYKARTGG
jgi:peroxiredoxin